MSQESYVTIANDIVGIFNKKTDDKRLVLIVHGAGEHKNYMFFPLLAERLQFSSFRFDFHGCGESGGELRYAHLEDNVADLRTVASYFEDQGYIIFAIIGHSRGAVASLKYAATCKMPLSHVVNIAGRYKMDGPGLVSDDEKQAMAEQGYFEWPVMHHGKLKKVKVTQKDLDDFTSWDNSHLGRISKATCVLTVHGLDDKTVFPQDAAMFANQVSTHTLKLVPGADHAFSGMFNYLVSLIVDHIEKHEMAPYNKARAMGMHLGVTIPRWIDVEGVKNFRDIGGWPTRDGHYIRERTMFRCGHLGEITENGINTLKALRVASIFDFRSDCELKPGAVTPDIPGIKVYRSAIFEDSDFGPDKVKENLLIYLEGAEGFFKGYKKILNKAKDQYRKLFLAILEQSSKPFVVHCRSGKDRTGLFFMILLGFCGVPDDIIAEEYALTTLGAWDTKASLQLLADSTNVPLADLLTIMGAPLEAIKLTIQYIKAEYGSFEGYLIKECGLNHEQCRAIRAELVVPIRFEQKQLYRDEL